MGTDIPFNKPFIVGKELEYISRSINNGKLSGDGLFTKKCHKTMEENFKALKVLLTHSCTAALEMAALLCDIQEGDEVILPSYTFVSTANAFYLRGAKLVFVDIRQDTLNMDETRLPDLITDRTKVIVPVHYAGVACEMDSILDIARQHNIFVVEDAAQGVNAKYKDKFLGTLGDIGTYSFHETKNIICGEGGAIVLNNEKLIERAEIIREKGTNRSKFFRGEVDKYTWVDVGSSFLPSDLQAAFLYAQLENMDKITSLRSQHFNYYYKALTPLAISGKIKLPSVPNKCQSNGHLFYIILEDEYSRDALMNYLKERGILAVFHYIALHLSPVGKQFGYSKGQLPVTESLSARLLRLPLYYEITENEQKEVVKSINDFFMET